MLSEMSKWSPHSGVDEFSNIVMKKNREKIINLLSRQRFDIQVTL